MRADLDRLAGICAWTADEQKVIDATKSELTLLRRLECAVTEYLCHSGRSKAWMSIDTLRQTVANIRKEINGER